MESYLTMLELGPWHNKLSPFFTFHLKLLLSPLNLGLNCYCATRCLNLVNISTKLIPVTLKPIKCRTDHFFSYVSRLWPLSPDYDLALLRYECGFCTWYSHTVLWYMSFQSFLFVLWNIILYTYSIVSSIILVWNGCVLIIWFKQYFIHQL